VLGAFEEKGPPIVKSTSNEPDCDVLSESHWDVLRRLEDREQELINFGIYETVVSASELAEGVNKDPSRIRDLLQDLRERYRVLSIGEGEGYRSRISEIVRLLANVKRRFHSDDIRSAPYLIRSLRVRFKDRHQQDRETPLARVSDRLADPFLRRDVRRNLERAKNALHRGMKTAILGGDPAGDVPDEDVKLTRVQTDALDRIGESYLKQKGGSFVVTGNTGSGKTEASLWPLLLGAAEEKLNSAPGCKVILTYPRKQLAKNQLQRICKYCAYINRDLNARGRTGQQRLSVGIVFGDTPRDREEIEEGGYYKEDLVRGNWGRNGDYRELPYFRNENDDPVLFRMNRGHGEIRSTEGGWDDGGWVLNRFRPSRKDIREDPPDVLIITTEMLHKWLMRPDYAEFFGVGSSFTPPRALVLDEIHLYDTTHGAQIGMLVRRLRHRLREAMREDDEDEWEEPLCIGMSATIGDPPRFWGELSGYDSHDVVDLSPSEEDRSLQTGRERLLFLQPETYSRGQRVGSASVAIQAIMCIAHNMVRRPSVDGGAPKHRTLAFQDSISKLKKLALEFHDAEVNLGLSRFRLGPRDEDEFREGEYWYFDVEDPRQYSEERNRGGDPTNLTVAPSPVYSGNQGLDALNRDIVFATSVLEVGYDDPSIQFVYQHHAPNTTASFVQKKGRAGRSTEDRPITAVTLSRHSYKDAFYFQNPDYLIEAGEYNPPLNVENYFVQRFHSLALFFDELARLEYPSDIDYTRVNAGREEVDAQLDRIEEALSNNGRLLQRAFDFVTASSFRRALDQGHWEDVWADFVDEFDDSEIRERLKGDGTRNLMRVNPRYPSNLFGSINMPALRLGAYPTGRADQMEWQDEDVGQSLSTLAPGKVTRRYSQGQWVHWRPPQAYVADDGYTGAGKAALERYKEDRDGGPGPFDPERIQQLAEEWGEGWRDILPNNVHNFYDGDIPSRFYRPRFVEAWTIGEVSEDKPRDIHRAARSGGWQAWASLDTDRDVITDVSVGEKRPDDDWASDGQEWRPVSPDSKSFSLSFSYARPKADDQGERVPSKRTIALPPVYDGLVEDVDFYFGEKEQKRSAIKVWEAHYGADASIQLASRGPEDLHAGRGDLEVEYISEHDGAPILYGYKLETEGLKIPYDKVRLEDLARELYDDIFQEEAARLHLQDQFLRYILKSESWSHLNKFDRRRAAELISTMRAVSRSQDRDVDAFLDNLFDPEEQRDLIDGAKHFWQESGTLTDEFLERFTRALNDPGAEEAIRQAFQERVRSREEVMDYIQSTILHSLKHGMRNLFVADGSTRDEEVGSFGMFKLTYGHWSTDEDALWIYERNQDGSGATRLVDEVLSSKGKGYVLKRWWDSTLACPVGDEEAFIKTVIREESEALRAYAEAHRDDGQEPPDPEDFLKGLGARISNSRHVKALSRLLVAQDRIYGSEGIPRIELVCEIQEVEDLIAKQFHRRPTVGEVASYTLSLIRNDERSDRYPALSRMLSTYEEHDERLSGSGDPNEASIPEDRFISQVRQLSLSTCSDACEACIGSRCDQGPVQEMKHALSRTLLKRAHRLLTSSLTVEYDRRTDAEELIRTARDNSGWVILRREQELDVEFKTSLRESGFDLHADITDPNTLEGLTIYYLSQ
jgi:hypothetical protein